MCYDKLHTDVYNSSLHNRKGTHTYVHVEIKGDSDTLHYTYTICLQMCLIPFPKLRNTV